MYMMIRKKIRTMEKVEVFRTNVEDQGHARMLLDRIHESFNYQANFDLEDCDKILRVRYTDDSISVPCLIKLLNELGFNAEVLPD
jgi:hypothetical protein